MIPPEYLKKCANILKFPSYNSRDELFLAEIELYRVLRELIKSDKIQTDNVNWIEIENMRKKHEHIYRKLSLPNSTQNCQCLLVLDLDSSEPLRFAYSGAYLILARRTLKHIRIFQEDGRCFP